MTTDFREPSFLSSALQVSLAVTSVCAVVVAAASLLMGTTDAEVEAFIAQSEWGILFAALVGLVALGQVLGFVVCVVLFPMFMYRATKNLQGLRDTVLSASPNMAAGGWFIPFANLVYPYRTLVELDQASLPADEQRSNAVIGVYWACWIVANFLYRAGEAVPVAELVAAVFLAVAGVLAVLIVRRIDANQRRLASSRETSDLAPIFA